ncbi:MAG: AMP-binding protein [Clostridiales bacterium]|jgi:acetyl-CoA synthetase|nr:AMP-binding protein [Clostridiales bacterium]
MLERFLERTEFKSYQDFKENYKLKIPENFNFGFDVVDAWGEEEPEKMALVWCNDSGEEKRLKFSDISRESGKIANMLASKGIGKGDKVLLILKRRYEYWQTATALHKIGAVLIPGSVQLTSKDIAYRISAADIKMIIAVNEEYTIEQIEKAVSESPSKVAKGLIGSDRPGWFNFNEEIKSHSSLFERRTGVQEVKATDLMLMYFTSGTTGMPKMAVHDQTYPLGHITTAKYWQRVQNNGLHLTVSDSGWAKFGWGCIYGQWIAGTAIMGYDMDKFIPDKLLKVVEKYKVTTFCAPPTMFRYFIKEDLTKYDLSSVKHAGIAGEPLNPEVFNQFLKATGIKLHEGFGQSESSVFLANYEWFDPLPGSTGKPSPLYDIDLLDEDSNSCPVGEEGEIVVKGVDKPFPTGLFKGYFENGEVSVKCFENGIYRTGDMAWRDINGHYWFVGRTDDVIKCSGYRIGPFEVESAVLEHPAVLECAITAFPDEIRGQVVKATIVLANGYEPSDEIAKEIQEHVKKTTAPYKYPRKVEFVKELPKTLGGKIKRAQIKRENEETAKRTGH